MKQLTFLLFLSCASFASYGQNAIEGPTSNLCPGATYQYVSQPGCDDLGWGCSGCTASSYLSNGLLANTGQLSDGSPFAIVSFADVSTATIHNSCGSLNVTLKAIAQPSISPGGGGAQRLCGSGSITFTANVTSTANITGYTWSVAGSGVSPIGVTTTTGPTFTVNYTNWNATSGYSATVAVGAINSNCNYRTPIAPLTGAGAISSFAWVTLLPGAAPVLGSFSINNPTLAICSSTTLTTSGQPSGTTLSWSSSNTSGLSITSSGLATRVNNYNGPVGVTATAANLCGSVSTSSSVQVGTLSSSIGGPTSGCAGNGDDYNFSATSSSVASYNWTVYGVSGTIDYGQGGPTAGISFQSQGNYAIECDITDACGTTQNFVNFNCDCGGFGSDAIVATPNPATDQINVSVVPNTVNVSDNSTEEFSITLINSTGNIVKTASTSNGHIKVNTSDLPLGTYYLNVIAPNRQKMTTRILVQH